MKAAKKSSQSVPRDNGAWLLLLLTDIQGEIAQQPTPRAVARIRRRVQAAIKTPIKAAA
jgi:hypothetical protein